MQGSARTTAPDPFLLGTHESTGEGSADEVGFGNAMTAFWSLLKHSPVTPR
jgi:hypothetical protein